VEVLDETEYLQLTAADIACAVNAGALSAVEVIDAALARGDRVDPPLRAFTQVWPDRARVCAEQVDRAQASGARLGLAGVPIGVKASEGLDSVQTRRLLAAGCVAIGTTSVPTSATAWQTWGHTDRGPTVNPYHAAWSPGVLSGFCGCGGRGHRAAGHRQRWCRIDPYSRRVVRRRRTQTDHRAAAGP
jgi:amidase